MLQFWKSVVLFSTIAAALSAKLPSQFGRCKKADYECLKKNAEDAILKSGNGIEEVGIPQIDPYLIPSVTIQQRPGPVSLTQNYTDLLFYGFSKNKVINLSMNLDPDNCHLLLEMFTPKVDVKGRYFYEGQILTLPLKGDGEIEGIHEDFKHSNNITCEIYQKHGNDHVRITDIKTKFTFGPTTFHFGELFKGNPELSKQIENSINEDPSVLLEPILPEFEIIWKSVVQSGANGFFSHVPLKEIFLDY